MREYLHANGIAVLAYEQIWNSLESLGERVKAERALKAANGDSKPKAVEKPGEVVKDTGKGTEEKVVKTDKVLVGQRTSWAMVKAVGEVRHLQCTAKEVLTQVP